MYVNPFPFGVFIGVVSTIILEIAALIIIGTCKGDKE